MHTGDIPQGESDIIRALEINPRVKYGRPYLRLADAFRDSDREKALHYLEQFHSIHSSSSEAFYLLGYMYQSLGRTEDAKKSYQESMDVYRSLPKYKNGKNANGPYEAFQEIIIINKDYINQRASHGRETRGRPFNHSIGYASGLYPSRFNCSAITRYPRPFGCKPSTDISSFSRPENCA